MSTTDKSVANAEEQVTKGTKRAAEVRLGPGMTLFLVHLVNVTFFFLVLGFSRRAAHTCVWRECKAARRRASLGTSVVTRAWVGGEVPCARPGRRCSVRRVSVKHLMGQTRGTEPPCVVQPLLSTVLLTAHLC